MARRFEAILLGAVVLALTLVPPLALTMVIAGCTISAKPMSGVVFVRPAVRDDQSIGSLDDAVSDSRRLVALVSLFADGRIDAAGLIDAILAGDEKPMKDETPGLDLQAEMRSLTDGLTGSEFLAISGWPLRARASEPIHTRARVHAFSDENDENTIDLTFLWRADWSQPDPVPGVTIRAWMAGDLADDDPRDLQVFRVTGAPADVTAALEGMRDERTPVQVRLENGATILSAP